MFGFSILRPIPKECCDCHLVSAAGVQPPRVRQLQLLQSLALIKADIKQTYSGPSPGVG
jgi:hypothetical protein